jgi:cobalt-zinc-cadmium efflux system membrane fusion protein
MCLLASALLGCGGSRTQNGNDPGKQESLIQLATVSSETVQDELAIPGKVQADPERIVRIYPPVSGRVVALSVHPGDVVSKGQTIATLESSDAASARSDYQKASVEATRTAHAEKRAELLLEHEAMSQKDYEEIHAQAESARSDLARAQQRLRMLGISSSISSDQVPVRAPRAGVVLEIGAANGELSKSLDNANSLATIADLSSVWVVGDVYEKDLSLVNRGTPVRLSFAAFPDRDWKGSISNVSDVLDPNTRSLKVRLVLPNPDHKLKPEMFVTIHVAGRKQRLTTVPTTAVLHDGGNTFVMVKRADGSFEKRSVQVASSQPDHTEIRTGLQPGETIVISGAELLRDQGAGSS